MKDKEKDFEKVVEEMHPMILSIIKRLNIYKNHEEFYQIALIALWEAYRSYNPTKAKFSTFAYHYIQGYLKTELQRQTRKDDNEHQPDDVGWNQIANQLKEESEHDEWFLQDLIKQLKPKQQQFIDLHFMKGMKLTEIAEILGVSYPTVKYWRKQALAVLREKLMKE